MDTEALREEIEVLRERLFEAEEVCRALRDGEVDAVVVGRSEDEKRVMLMSGAYARYRQIVEDMEQGAVTLTAAGEILFANHSFAAMVDKPLLELFRTPLDAYIAPEDRAAVAEVRAAPMGSADTVVTLVGRGTRARLSVVSASDDFTTLLVTDVGYREAIDEAMATLEAIRKGAVDAFVVDGEHVVLLEDPSTPYRALVERMHEGAVIVDGAGHITYANAQFLSAAAYHAPAAILGRRLADLVPDADHAALESLLEAREAAQAEMRLSRGRGDSLPVHVTMTRLDGHRLLLFRDTSLQKRHQASDERTRKFLGMLAHEFRNILNPMANSLAYLKASGTLDGEAAKAVAILERQTQRLTGLVEDLRRINPKD